MGWLKDILQENRRVVNSWPEWKRRVGMSFNKSYIDQMKVMGALPYDTRLEQENAQLKARVHELDGELERHAWPYSLAMAEAKINQLNEEVAQLKEELAQCHADKNEMVRRNKLLRDRPDLPIERLAAYDEVILKLAQATQREARLRALLREAVECFCVTEEPDDYPVDSWINKALAELRRPEEAGT